MAPPRQCLRIFALQKADKLFAELGAEIGYVADTGCSDEDAQLDGLSTGIGDLHIDELAARLLGLPDQINRLGANTVDRRGVIKVKQHTANVSSRLPRPIVEWLLNEIIERHDQPPEVPEADDDIGCGDFFDPSIFVLNRHGVFKPDWLRHRQLNPGAEITHDRLGGEAEKYAGDASGCK